MKHPSQASLALHAGDDLGPIARWRINRHLNVCKRCQDELATFAATREILPELNEIPDVPWSLMAAEMRANIRLGLAAGECVRPGEVPLRKSLFSGARAAVALATLTALVVTGLVLERPLPRRAFSRFGPESGIFVESRKDGIAIGQGREVLELRHTGASSVTYSVDAQGAMRARYVDPETGYVTVNNVYVEQ